MYRRHGRSLLAPGAVRESMKRLFQRFAESIGVETCLPLLIVALAMTLFLFGLRLPLLRVSPIDPDELSHLHCAWSVSKGMLIYRDFFENHTPWFYFLVAPLFSFFSVETNISDAFFFFFGARYLMWLAAGASLVLTFRIGILWRNAPVAWVGTIFLSLTTVFLGKTIEIRPDVPALAFFLACLITVIGAMRSEGSGLGVRSRFALSGAFLGAALMFLPKILLVGPGFALAMLWYVCDPRGRRNFGDRLRDVIWQSIGFAVPLGLTMGYFASRGALQEFIWFNLLLNLTYGATTSMSPLPLLKFLLRESPFLVVLGLIGFARGFFEMFGSVNFRRGDYVLVSSALSLFAGLFLTPLPYHQYYVMFLPLLALFAATSLVQLAEFFVAALGRRGERGNFSARLGTTLTLLTGAGLWLLIRWVGPPVLIEASYIWLWVSAVVVSLPFFLARKRDWVLVIYLVALSVGPFESNVQGVESPQHEIQGDTSADRFCHGEHQTNRSGHGWFHRMGRVSSSRPFLLASAGGVPHGYPTTAGRASRRSEIGTSCAETRFPGSKLEAVLFGRHRVRREKLRALRPRYHLAAEGYLARRQVIASFRKARLGQSARERFGGARVVPA